MVLPILIIVVSLIGSLLIHYFTLFKMNQNEDFLETKSSTILSMIKISCEKNLSWCILLMIASFIIENETIPTIKNEIPTILFSNRYYFLLLLSTFNSYKITLKWDKIIILKRKEKNSKTPIEDLKHLLQIIEKRKELVDRKLNFLKSFSFIPILLLLINNLSSLKEKNPTLEFSSLLLMNKLNIYILLGIIVYIFISYNTFYKCQLLTRQEIYLLNRINFLSLKINLPKHHIFE